MRIGESKKEFFDMGNLLKRLVPIAVCIVFIVTFYPISAYDINIIGSLNPLNSVARHTESFIFCLHAEKDLKIVNVSLEDCIDQYPQSFRNLIQNKIIKKSKQLKGISIFCPVANKRRMRQSRDIPDECIVKYAYCVAESNQIAPHVVKYLNNNFDGLLLADEWLIDVYKSSGVDLPMFVLPLCLDLKPFLIKEKKKLDRKSPFIFGFSAGMYRHKNQEKLARAFASVFKGRADVILKVHTRFAKGVESIKKSIESLDAPNIIFFEKAYSRNEYIDFISSLDCYVSLSMGEGFSIIPREALAAGIPCILSNNTAQQTICNTGFVYSVPSSIQVPVNRSNRAGFFFDTSFEDAKNALSIVYNNYDLYLQKALGGKEWVQQYLTDSLKPKYLSLVKPKTVILSDCNAIGDTYIKTDSVALYEKYQKLLKCDKQ